jgi:hypothetical protein
MPDTKRQQQIQGLRDLADFYETVPEDVPLPFAFQSELLVFLHDNAKEHLRHIGSFEKRFEDLTSFGFIAVKKVGIFDLHFYAKRSDVCVRNVVGTRTIPAETIPATREQFIPEHEEEIVEWDCEPVLTRGEQ